MGNVAANDKGARSFRANRVAGAVLIALGALFLLERVLDVQWSEVLWPLIVVGVGIVFFAVMLSAGRSSGFLAIPASVITITGLVLLFQNSVDYWSSWSYAWALVGPAGVGVGLLVWGWYGRTPSLTKAGRVLVTVGIILFLVFGTFFELVLRVGSGAGRFVWPFILIALGFVLLLRRVRII